MKKLLLGFLILGSFSAFSSSKNCGVVTKITADDFFDDYVEMIMYKNKDTIRYNVRNNKNQMMNLISLSLIHNKTLCISVDSNDRRRIKSVTLTD